MTTQSAPLALESCPGSTRMYLSHGWRLKHATSVSAQPLSFGQIRTSQLQTKTGGPARKSRCMETWAHMRAFRWGIFRISCFIQLSLWSTCATGWIVSQPSVPTCPPGVAQISINHWNIVTMLWIVLLMSINKEWLTFTDIWFYLKHMIDGKQSILSLLYKFKNWNLGPPINLLKLLKFYVKANVENKTQDFWRPCQCSGTLLAPAAFHQMYPWEARSISTSIEKGTGGGAPCPVATGPAWEVKGEVNFQIKSLLESCKMWASY